GDDALVPVVAMRGLAGLEIPYPNEAGGVGPGERLAVGRKRQGAKRVRITGENLTLLAAGRVPEPDGLVRRRRRQRLAVGRKRQRGDALMAQEAQELVGWQLACFLRSQPVLGGAQRIDDLVRLDFPQQPAVGWIVEKDGATPHDGERERALVR